MSSKFILCNVGTGGGKVLAGRTGTLMNTSVACEATTEGETALVFFASMLTLIVQITSTLYYIKPLSNTKYLLGSDNNALCDLER